jgi:hypothetical protein
MTFGDIFDGGTSAGLLDGARDAVELLVAFVAIFGDSIGMLVAEPILFSSVVFHRLRDVLKGQRVLFVQQHSYRGR